MGVVYLEGHEQYSMRDNAGADTEAAVFVRYQGQRLDEVRLVAANCTVDGGDQNVYLFNGVSLKESFDQLANWALGEKGLRKNAAEGATLAVAYHDDQRVEDLLERVARERDPHAAFWLGSARGARGLETLQRLVRDQDDDLREQAVVGLAMSPEENAVDVLLNLAHHDDEEDVRRQAIFWLGQKASERIVAEIGRIVDEDPDIEIKKHAVFALSQRSDDESVPYLIKQARTHPHPEIRKTAIFWLGQKDDPRALSFIEEILSR